MTFSRLRNGSLWREAAIVGVLNVAYQAVVALSAGNASRALAHAQDAVIPAERWLGAAVEPAWSAWLLAHHALATAASVWYVAGQWAGAAAALLWLWRARKTAYARERRTLLVMTGVGLLVFLLWPVAPPRLAETGVVDVVARLRTAGDFHRGALAAAADEYGAMPSLHVAWAVWCARVCWMARGRAKWPARALGAVYAVGTALVVVATGNHYVLDVAAGILTVPLCYAVERRASVLWRALAIRRAREGGDAHAAGQAARS